MSDTSNPPSIRDIAEIAGVSVATVSRVLNKKGKYSATTEKRVLAVVNSCGYISNMSAKSLREARSHTVGLIVPNVTNAFFSQLAYSIETELFQRNYSVFICNSGTDADKERDYFRTLIGKCVDGILCISVAHRMRTVEAADNIIVHSGPGRAHCLHRPPPRGGPGGALGGQR